MTPQERKNYIEAQEEARRIAYAVGGRTISPRPVGEYAKLKFELDALSEMFTEQQKQLDGLVRAMSRIKCDRQGGE